MGKERENKQLAVTQSTKLKDKHELMLIEQFCK